MTIRDDDEYHLALGELDEMGDPSFFATLEEEQRYRDLRKAVREYERKNEKTK